MRTQVEQGLGDQARPGQVRKHCRWRWGKGEAGWSRSRPRILTRGWSLDPGPGPQFPRRGEVGSAAPSAPRTAPSGLETASSEVVSSQSTLAPAPAPAPGVTLGSPLYPQPQFLLKQGML